LGVLDGGLFNDGNGFFGLLFGGGGFWVVMMVIWEEAETKTLVW
jgi:hypothetical protein